MHPALGPLLARPIAHRGLHEGRAGRVENSLEAAEAAAAAGFGIECDVQLSADGDAIVFHDETLERLTGAAGRVDARPAVELAGVRLRGGGAIPTLALFLERVGGRVPLVIEIKSDGHGARRLADRVAALLATYRGPAALKSFDPAVVDRCRRVGATCPLGLVGAGTDDVPDRPSDFDFLSWCLDDLATLRARAPGAPLMSWTIRSPDQAARAAALNAQIVFEGFLPAVPSGADLPRPIRR